jgi:hypothetical protein
MHDKFDLRLFPGEGRIECAPIRKVEANELETSARQELIEPSLFQLGIVIFVQIVQSDDRFSPIDERMRNVRTNETGRPVTTIFIFSRSPFSHSNHCKRHSSTKTSPIPL